MKKLGKKLNSNRETLQAYACSCGCPCSCGCDYGGYYDISGRSISYMMSSVSFQRTA
ncbi:MAG: CLI_3235 family bacteriocin precursor [Bacillota bacterium]